MRAEAFILHLERATGRRANVERLASAIETATGLAVRTIHAIDGKLMQAADIAAVYRPSLHAPNYPFPLSAAEIACFLSHRKCWQELVERGLDAALIVEDDVELTPAFAECWALAIRQPEGFIRFAKNGREEAERVLGAAPGGARHISPKVVGLGMIGQVVDRATAQRLLECTRVFDRPVDTMLQMFWLTGIKPTVIQPEAFREISAGLGGSTIQQARRSGWQKFSREFSRFLYRSRIRRLSAR